MNILKRELRAGLKPFIFWTIGLFILVFAGITKYTGIAVEGASASELIAQLPRVALATFGIIGVKIETLSGYYAVLSYYSMICVSIYAIALGATAVNREAVDKTYEFMFTKPRCRKYILKMKLLASFVYLIGFCLLNYLFSILATVTLNLSENINNEILLFTIAIFLVGFLFFGISAFLSTIVSRTEKGTLYGNLCFLFAFVVGIIYDMLEDGGILRVLTPLKYFIPSDLIAGKLNVLYAILCVCLTVTLIFITLHNFDKKDLRAA